MPREVKDPEERKQELIGIAKELFFSKGYEKTSVRDILKEVNGAPGMFYHYFKSKREIYEHAINQYILDYVSTLTKVMTNKEMQISDRLLSAMNIFEKTFLDFLSKADTADTVENLELISVLQDQIVANLVKPISIVIEDAINEDIVRREMLPVDDLEIVSSFIMYGIFGVMSSESKTSISIERAKFKIHSVPLLISRTLGVDVNVLFKWRDLHGINERDRKEK